MSYDVSLTINTGADENVEVVDIGNYTSNVAAMWRHALPNSWDGLDGLDGRLCGSAAVGLHEGVKHMEANPQVYKPMEPENGWGSYFGALSFLDRLAKAARQHPACTIKVDR